MLDVGHTEDWFALHIAMAPCLIGYGVIAQRLYHNPLTKREGNIYWNWIENYVADDYVEAVRVGSGMLLILHCTIKHSIHANFEKTQSRSTRCYSLQVV